VTILFSRTIQSSPATPLNWPNPLASTDIPQSFWDIQQYLFEPNRVDIGSSPQPEPESPEYGALRFMLNGRKSAFRQAKTTPKKIGQFVTLWKRDTPSSDIAPIDYDDEVEFVVIATSDEHRHGVFVFDRATLARKGVMSVRGRGGKRAMRIYPPWTSPTSKQAARTQAWQLNGFYSLD